VPFEKDRDLSVSGDDDLAAPQQDPAGDLTGGRCDGRAAPRSVGEALVGMQASEVVDLVDFGFDESRGDVGHRDPVALELGPEAGRESSNCELAHAVGSARRKAHVSRHAPDQRQTTAASFQILEGRKHGPQHSKHVGLELSAVVFEGQRLELADDTESRVGDDDVDSAELILRPCGGRVEVAVAADIAGDGQSFPSAASDLGRQAFESVESPRRQNQASSPKGEFARQRGADAGGCPGDEDDGVVGEFHRKIVPYRAALDPFRSESAPIYNGGLEVATMGKPTKQDADLLLRLYEIRREPEMRRARAWFMREFPAGPWSSLKAGWGSGAEEDRFIRMVTSYWDMVAALVNNGVLHEELFFQTNGENLVVWKKTEPWIGDRRQDAKAPYYLSNLEELCLRHQAFRARWHGARKGPVRGARKRA
jgi:hypothetical protein